jgi:hypothetical protein
VVVQLRPENVRFVLADLVQSEHPIRRSAHAPPDLPRSHWFLVSPLAMVGDRHLDGHQMRHWEIHPLLMHPLSCQVVHAEDRAFVPLQVARDCLLRLRLNQPDQTHQTGQSVERVR